MLHNNNSSKKKAIQNFIAALDQLISKENI